LPRCCVRPPVHPVILISWTPFARITSVAIRRAPATPHIDALAKNGTLFSQVSSPFPLTLPAHVALFTSTYAFANGCRRMRPAEVYGRHAATVLKGAGYKTGAFVGSFVLDRRFGLNHVLTSTRPLDLHKQTTAGAIERKRPGEQVQTPRCLGGE